jgi:hypothetical protein
LEAGEVEGFPHRDGAKGHCGSGLSSSSTPGNYGRIDSRFDQSVLNFLRIFFLLN